MGCVSSHEGKSSHRDAYTKRLSHGNGSVVSSPPDLSDDHFSQHHKRLLRETWTLLGEDKQRLGIDIFNRIFERKPDAKQLFPFRDLTGDELMKNPMFRSHAKRFMHAVETTMQNLDALEVAVIPVLHRLGEKHIWITRFKEEYVPLFIEVILDVFVEEFGKKCTNQVRDAWGHLAKFIAAKMLEGYESVSQGNGNATGNGHVVSAKDVVITTNCQEEVKDTTEGTNTDAQNLTTEE